MGKKEVTVADIRAELVKQFSLFRDSAGTDKDEYDGLDIDGAVAYFYYKILNFIDQKK